MDGVTRADLQGAVAPHVTYGGEAHSYNYDPRQVCRPATRRGCDNNL